LHAFVVEQIGEHQRNYKVLQIKNIGIEHLKEKGLLIELWIYVAYKQSKFEYGLIDSKGIKDNHYWKNEFVEVSHLFLLF